MAEIPVPVIEVGDEVKVVSPLSEDDGRVGLVYGVEGDSCDVIFVDDDGGTNVFSATELIILKKCEPVESFL
jgi:hypothetical protein